MSFRTFQVTAVCLVALFAPHMAVAQDHKLETVKGAPPGLSPEVAVAISDSGYRITGKDGVVCEVWLAKELPLKPKFKSSLRIKYPLLTGTLMGVIHFPDGSKPTDFRGQNVKPGVYTLRYGLQPDDGNHLGTSDIRDFLVGCSPAKDVKPGRIENIKDMFKLSADAIGTTHPAIFLLLPPPEKPFEAAAVRHDTARELLILDVNATLKDGDKFIPLPISVVTVGKTEG